MSGDFVQRERERLDAVAKRFDSSVDFDSIHLSYFARQLGPLISGRRVLELGCSSGVMSVVFAEQAARLDIVDGSSEYIEAVREKVSFRTVRLHTALFEEYEPEIRYDTIVCSHVLEHVADPVALLRRIKSWLDTDGTAVISVPNARSIHRMLGVAMNLAASIYELSERDHMLAHRRVYDSTSLEADIRAAGLEPGPLGGTLLKPFPNGVMSSLAPDVTRGLLKVGDLIPEHASEIHFRCRLPTGG